MVRRNRNPFNSVALRVWPGRRWSRRRQVAGWLSVQPGTGQLPASLTASVNPAGLPLGTYQGTITVQAPVALPSFDTISVSLTVLPVTVPAGIITTVAGNGICCFSGDGGQATSASLGLPYAVAMDASGSLYIADSSNRVRKVSPGGIISTVAGNGNAGFSGTVDLRHPRR